MIVICVKDDMLHFNIYSWELCYDQRKDPIDILLSCHDKSTIYSKQEEEKSCK